MTMKCLVLVICTILTLSNFRTLGTTPSNLHDLRRLHQCDHLSFMTYLCLSAIQRFRWPRSKRIQIFEWTTKEIWNRITIGKVIGSISTC
jgi:hypothetical protein